jgi:hypothetical protein
MSLASLTYLSSVPRYLFLAHRMIYAIISKASINERLKSNSVARSSVIVKEGSPCFTSRLADVCWMVIASQ